jgi:hypothetical protein
MDQNYEAAPDKSGRNTFFVMADMFPQGMAETLKAGEVIEFRIVAPPDKDGEIEVEYNFGDEGEAKETPGEGESTESGGGESWEQEARSALDPQAKESETY